jgi:hypothetical protein
MRLSASRGTHTGRAAAERPPSSQTTAFQEEIVTRNLIFAGYFSVGVAAVVFVAMLLLTGLH